MIASGPLPETDTRDRWSWAYADTRDPAGLSAGELLITEHSGVKVKRTVTDTFDVEPCPCLGRPGRAFLLCRLSRSGDLDTAKGKAALARCGNVYETHLYADGGHACTCDAGRMQPTLVCLHVHAIRALLEKVVIAEPTNDSHPWDHASLSSEDVAHAIYGAEDDELQHMPHYRDEW